MKERIEKSYIYKGQEKGFSCLFFRRLDSTQSTAAALLEKGKIDGDFVVICDSQSKGRGRYDRRFVSPKNKGVYLTAVFEAPSQPFISILSGLCALPIIDTISQFSSLAARIKWPNDVLICGRKVAGILPQSKVILTPKRCKKDLKSVCGEGKTAEQNGQNEACVQGQKASQAQPCEEIFNEQTDACGDCFKRYCLIGIGVNITATAEDLAGVEGATSLLSEGAKGIDIRQFALELAEKIFLLSKQINDELTLPINRYKQLCVGIGSVVRFEENGVSYEGVLSGIADDLSAVATMPNGVARTFGWGEISFKKPL